jgi:hypothetical protein
VALCAVCTVHVETRSASFLVESQNQGRRFINSLTSKPRDGFSSVWASKPMAMVCEWFDLKTTWTVFVGLASKPVATVSGGLVSKPAVMVFCGFASKHVTTVSSGLASKLAATVSRGLTSKPVATVFSGLASKSVVMIFSSLTSKLVATVFSDLPSNPVVGFLVEPQNQDGGGFPNLCIKTSSFGLVI